MRTMEPTQDGMVFRSRLHEFGRHFSVADIVKGLLFYFCLTHCSTEPRGSPCKKLHFNSTHKVKCMDAKIWWIKLGMRLFTRPGHFFFIHRLSQARDTTEMIILVKIRHLFLHRMALIIWRDTYFSETAIAPPKIRKKQRRDANSATKKIIPVYKRLMLTTNAIWNILSHKNKTYNGFRAVPANIGFLASSDTWPITAGRIQKKSLQIFLFFE